MKFRWPVAAAIALLALALTSCSPPVIGAMGILRQEDGSLQVLLRVCRDSVTTLMLDPINSFPHAVNGEPTSDAWRSAPQPEVALSPSVSGAATIAMPADELAIRADVLYMLRAAGRTGNVFSAHFDASKLADLAAGQVLSSESLYEEGDVVTTPEEFHRYADEYCA